MADNPNDYATKGDLNDAVTELRDEMRTMRVEMTEQFSSQTADIIRHINVAIETVRHDVGTANQDELSLHDDRLTRLEEHTGLLKT